MAQISIALFSVWSSFRCDIGDDEGCESCQQDCTCSEGDWYGLVKASVPGFVEAYKFDEGDNVGDIHQVSHYFTVECTTVERFNKSAGSKHARLLACRLQKLGSRKRVTLVPSPPHQIPYLSENQLVKSFDSVRHLKTLEHNQSSTPPPPRPPDNPWWPMVKEK